MNRNDQRIGPVDAWRIFSAIRLHFTGSYDAHRYNFRMPNLKASAFESRKDRYYFERAAKRYPAHDDYVWFCVSNILCGNKWIGDTADEPVVETRARLDSLTYRFTADTRRLSEAYSSLDLILRPIGGRPPEIWAQRLLGNISLETVSIFEALTGFLAESIRKVSDPLGMHHANFIVAQKYVPFLKDRIELCKMKTIVTNMFTS